MCCGWWSGSIGEAPEAHREATQAAAAEDNSAATTPVDAAALGSTLQGQLDRLIDGCTMTGPAHDQLHVFLSRFMPRVAELSRVTDPAEGTRLLTELTGLLAEAERVFE